MDIDVRGTYLESKESVVQLYCLFFIVGVYADTMEEIERRRTYDVD
jgi:hypothetical protein